MTLSVLTSIKDFIIKEFHLYEKDYFTIEEFLCFLKLIKTDKKNYSSLY